MRQGFILMVCRNTLAYSREALKTLQAQTVDCDILVINNDSSDGTAQWLRAEQVKDKRLFAISFSEVRSVAEAWNTGLRWGWKRGYREALVVNNDTELMPHTYGRLYERMTYARSKTHDLGMVTGVSVRDRSELREPDEWSDRPHPDYSCYMIAKWCHERVPFDENCIGAFLEDNIHHITMHRKGIKAINIGMPFLHHASMTIKTATAEERKRIQECAAHNKEYFRSLFGCVPGTSAYSRLFT